MLKVFWFCAVLLTAPHRLNYSSTCCSEMSLEIQVADFVTRFGRLLARLATSLGTTRMSPLDQKSATGLVMLEYWYTGGEACPHLPWTQWYLGWYRNSSDFSERCFYSIY